MFNLFQDNSGPDFCTYKYVSDGIQLTFKNKTERSKVHALALRNIRNFLGARSNQNIEIVEKPGVLELIGESGHYETPGGKIVYSPNAYRKAWGKCNYVKSTRMIKISIDIFTKFIIEAYFKVKYGTTQ